MDETKIKILDILKDNAKTPKKEIAAILDITEEKVDSLIKELEKDKVILRYKAIIDDESINGMVQALIEVKVSPERDFGFNKTAERIASFSEVKDLFLVAGDYDLMAVLEGKSMKDVASFVASKLSTIPNVAGTATHFLLKKYKEDNVIFAEKEKDTRLKVSP